MLLVSPGGGGHRRDLRRGRRLRDDPRGVEHRDSALRPRGRRARPAFVAGLVTRLRAVATETESALVLIGGIAFTLCFAFCWIIWTGPLVDMPGDNRLALAQAEAYLAIDDIGWFLFGAAGVGGRPDGRPRLACRDARMVCRPGSAGSASSRGSPLWRRSRSSGCSPGWRGSRSRRSCCWSRAARRAPGEVRAARPHRGAARREGRRRGRDRFAPTPSSRECRSGDRRRRSWNTRCMTRLAVALALALTLLASWRGGEVDAAEKRYRVVLVAEPIGVADTFWAVPVAGFRRAARELGIEARVVTQPNRTSFASTYGALRPPGLRPRDRRLRLPRTRGDRGGARPSRYAVRGPRHTLARGRTVVARERPGNRVPRGGDRVRRRLPRGSRRAAPSRPGRRRHRGWPPDSRRRPVHQRLSGRGAPREPPRPAPEHLRRHVPRSVEVRERREGADRERSGRRVPGRRGLWPRRPRGRQGRRRLGNRCRRGLVGSRPARADERAQADGPRRLPGRGVARPGQARDRGRHASRRAGGRTGAWPDEPTTPA